MGVCTVAVVPGLTVGRTITCKGRWRMNVSASTAADSFSLFIFRGVSLCGVLAWHCDPKLVTHIHIQHVHL